MSIHDKSYRLRISKTRCIHAVEFNHTASLCGKVGEWNSYWHGRMYESVFLSTKGDRNYCQRCRIAMNARLK